MKKFILIFSLFVILIFPLLGHSQLYEYSDEGFEGVNFYTYIGTTGNQVSCAWDSVVGAIGYNFKMYSVDRKAYVLTGTTEQNHISMFLPHQGVFIFMIQVYGMCLDGEGIPFECTSVWVASNETATSTVDGQHRGWWVYGFLGPPGPIQ